MVPDKTRVVLLVEDNPENQQTVRKALTNQETPIELHIAKSGEEACQYLLQSKDGNTESPMPGMILLDLHTQGIDEKEFLKKIKTDDNLCFIPVVILTLSDIEFDIRRCLKLHAAGHI